MLVSRATTIEMMQRQSRVPHSLEDGFHCDCLSSILDCGSVELSPEVIVVTFPDKELEVVGGVLSTDMMCLALICESEGFSHTRKCNQERNNSNDMRLLRRTA